MDNLQIARKALMKTTAAICCLLSMTTAVLLSARVPMAAQTIPIDLAQSLITVRVFKTGLFSVFAHDHEIRAPLSAGSITLAPNASVEFVVPTAKMVVLDPKLAADKRAEVQETMLGPKVLDVQRYPEIRFRTTQANAAGQGRWIVDGELTIRQETHPVRVTAEVAEDGSYRGAINIRQKDFGIQPISLAGGTIKIKDEIRIEFRVVAAE
ncbi:MAG: YceI family protein [Candidatus Korobacteraceae bacterium]